MSREIGAFATLISPSNVEIALEIEKVKHGHGKRETGEASGRDFLRRRSARKKRVKFAGGHTRTTSTYTCARLSA